MLKLLQMKNIIKKGLILLCFNLVVPTVALSQITLDSIEAKTTALIFNEHSKLSVENPLLKQQINSLEELNKLYVESDSIQKVEISTYKDKVSSNEKTIKKLKTAQKITIFGASLGGIALFILGLIL